MWAMVNIFVNRQRGLGATVMTPRLIFTSMTLKWRRQGHPGSNLFVDSESPIYRLATSHKCFIVLVTTCFKLISHHQEDIGDFHIRDLQMTPKGHLRSKVMMYFYYVHNGEQFCCNRQTDRWQTDRHQCCKWPPFSIKTKNENIYEKIIPPQSIFLDNATRSTTVFRLYCTT